jgi:hypothetical protein
LFLDIPSAGLGAITASNNHCNKQTNSMVWVRERTIPTERPPLVGEVIANFCE